MQEYSHDWQYALKTGLILQSDRVFKITTSKYIRLPCNIHAQYSNDLNSRYVTLVTSEEQLTLDARTFVDWPAIVQVAPNTSVELKEVEDWVLV